MNYLNIYANCILVRGNSMSLICDLQRRSYHHIPNDMYDIMTFLKENSIEQCYDHYGRGNKSIIKSYLDFLTKNDLAFIDSKIMKELPPIDLQWDAYSSITNCIFELSDNSVDYSAFLKNLLTHNIDAVEIRCYDDISLSKMNSFLELFRFSTVYNIKIIMRWSDWMTVDELTNLADDFLNISTIIVHSAPEDEVIKILKDSTTLLFSMVSIDSKLCCGNIHPKYFATNMELFTESQQHNTCLNRKLSIDKDGFIRNCPSMQNDFGHVSTTSLEEVLNHPQLKKYWFINKEQVSVCKDCEFRHVCTDCRAFLDDPQDDLSKPLKCGYNPYTNEWEDWTANPLKQNAIKYYGIDTLL